MEAIKFKLLYMTEYKASPSFSLGHLEKTSQKIFKMYQKH